MTPSADKNRVTLDYHRVGIEVDTTGAALTRLIVAGVSVIPDVERADAAGRYLGSVIAPWPNRIEDGTYSYRGHYYVLQCNETERNNSLHGLSAHTTWDVISRADDSVRLATTVGEVSGYPWRIGLEVTYRVTLHGVELSLTATNQSDTDAPFGAAFHPYFSLPGTNKSAWTLTMPATRVVLVEPFRLLPIDEVDVADSAFDFRGGETLGRQPLDHAFGGFEGSATAVLAGGSDVSVTVEASPECPWMQVHTPDDGPFAGTAVIEPQTCPPNAFRSGVDLIDLAPHRSTTVVWSVSVTQWEREHDPQ